MLNVLSSVIGVLALLGALVAFFPLLGWLNWLVIPLAVVGAAIGIFSRSNVGRNLNLFVILVAAVRLTLGGGIF